MRSYRRFLFVSAIIALVMGCDSFVLTEQFTFTNTLPLSIHPAAVATRPGEKVSFIAAGGRPAYGFSVSNPFGGNIDPVTGLYTAPMHDGEYEVEVKDADGAIGIGFVFVFKAKTLSITPTTATVAHGDVFEFGAYGGALPYSFSFSDSEIGAIDPETGVFKANDGISGTGIVTLEDLSGSIVTARVYVQDETTLMLTPAENPIQQGQTVMLDATGGVGEYGFDIVKDAGLLEYYAGANGYGVLLQDGVYTAGNSVGVVKLRVADENPDENARSSVLEMTILPATPADFAVSGATGDPKTVRLTWTHNKPGATGFRIERSLGGVTFVTIVDSSILGPDARSYLDTGLQPNTLYEYRMYAYLSERYESRATPSIPVISNASNP